MSTLALILLLTGPARAASAPRVRTGPAASASVRLAPAAGLLRPGALAPARPGLARSLPAPIPSLSPSAIAVPVADAAPTPERGKAAVAARVARSLRRNAAALLPAPYSRPDGLPEPSALDMDAYRQFVAADHWSRIKEDFAEELERVRLMPDKDAVSAYVRTEADKVLARIKAERGTSNVGLHYNLHGGQPEEYVKAGGIRATMGDIALNYTMSGDRNYKVYFYQTEYFSLYDALNDRNPQPLIPRMGSTLILFRRDAPEIDALEKSGAAARPSAISLDFDTERAKGIPASTFLAPPLDVFNGVGRKVGQKRLSRDEETLAVLRYLESAVVGARARPLHPLLAERSSSLELDGLSFKGSRLMDGDVRAPRLGRGEIGVVDAHPRIPGAVIKTMAPSAEIQAYTADFDAEKIRDMEADAARKMAAAGAGPRFFGNGEVGGALSSVRERIYGETLDALIRARRFGPEEHALVLELVDKLAAAGFVGSDMRPANIMLGRTAADPRRRAFVIDGARVIPLSGASLEEKRRAAFEHLVALNWRRDPHMGEIVNYKTLGEILEQGLARSRDKTWWQRLKRYFLS
jgi:hypothetical protein